MGIAVALAATILVCFPRAAATTVEAMPKPPVTVAPLPMVPEPPPIPEIKSLPPKKVVVRSGDLPALAEVEVRKMIAAHTANLSPEKQEEIYQTLKCESGLVPNKKGDYRNGKYTSFGIAQIHLPAHPDITQAQAEDPVFAINWTVTKFASGAQRMWTCWRKLYTKTPSK